MLHHPPRISFDAAQGMMKSGKNGGGKNGSFPNGGGKNGEAPVTPRSTVNGALNALQDVIKQPLTKSVRETLGELCHTLKELESAVRQQKVPRETLRGLYDDACSQAGSLKFEINASYKDAPELRDFLLSKVETSHSMLKAMHKALCDRLTVQLALQSLKDFTVSLKDQSLEITSATRDNLIALAQRCIEIFQAMVQKIPGYTGIRKLHDAAVDNIKEIRDRLKELLLGENSIADNLRKRLMYRIDLCTEYLHAVKDRMLKSESLYLALDTIDDIEKQIQFMYNAGTEKLITSHKEAAQKLVGLGHLNKKTIQNQNQNDILNVRLSKAQELVEESVKAALQGFQDGRDRYIYSIQLARDKILNFMKELLIVSDQNLMTLKSGYEDCFSALQDLSEHMFLHENLQNGAFTIEQVEMLRKKIGVVGEFLQDTVSKNHLTSKLLMSTAKYLQSLISIKKALKMMSNVKDTVINMVPYNKAIGEKLKILGVMFDDAYGAVYQILMFDKIKGLLPIDFVQQMFRTAFDLINNCRIAFLNLTLSTVNNINNMVKDGVITCITSAKTIGNVAYNTTSTIVSPVYNGTTAVVGYVGSKTMDVADMTIHNLNEGRKFILSSLNTVITLIINAQKHSIQFLTGIAMESIIFADKKLNVLGIAQWFLEKLQQVDRIQSTKFTGLKIQDRILEPVIVTGLGVSQSIDNTITGGKLSSILTDVVDEYQVRGGRVLETRPNTLIKV